MSDIEILVNGKPADHSLYTPIYPRRWYVPMPPRTAVWFGLLRRWWYLKRFGVVAQFDEPPPAGAHVTATYETYFN